MQQAMIVGVGTGTGPDSDIVAPLVKSIRNSNPNFLILVASEVSRSHAEKIRQMIGFDDSNSSIVVLSDHDSLEVTFQESATAIRTLVDRGFTSDEIIADFTSGTKAMSAGLTIAASMYACGSLKYVTGKRKGGVVVPGTERFLSVSPAAILARQNLNTAAQFIRQLQFAAARNILDSTNHAYLDERDRQLLHDLQGIASAYEQWDRFEHKRFGGEYSKITFSDSATGPFQLRHIHPNRIVDIGKAIERNDFSDDLCADLYNNAVRRFNEGKLDDCVARLYRLVEMLAQKALASHGVNTSSIDPSKLPAKVQAWLESKRGYGQQIQLGLRDDYELLVQMEHPLGLAFADNKSLGGLLQTRNNSILAHGFNPVGQSAADSFKGNVRKLAENLVENFEQRCSELQFPWLM